jgi:hypothetical protein
MMRKSGDWQESFIAQVGRAIEQTRPSQRGMAG